MKRFCLALAAAAAVSTAAPSFAADSPIAVNFADPSLTWGACPAIFPAGCEITVLQGDPAKPNADALLRVPGGYEIPPHSHTSAERMVLVSGTMTVVYQGHPPATLNAGDYAYGPAGLPHQATCAPGDPCVLFIAFEQPVDAVAFEGPLE
jgi:quercetin dioxygenase-like cupin family protein